MMNVIDIWMNFNLM